MTSDAPWTNEGKFCDTLRPFLPEQWPLERGMFATKLRTLLGNCPQVLNMLDQLGYGKWPALFPILSQQPGSSNFCRRVKDWAQESHTARAAIKAETNFYAASLVNYLDRISEETHPEGEQFVACVLIARLAYHGTENNLGGAINTVWQDFIKPWLADQWFPELGMSVGEVQDLLSKRRMPYQLVLADFREHFSQPVPGQTSRTVRSTSSK